MHRKLGRWVLAIVAVLSVASCGQSAGTVRTAVGTPSTTLAVNGAGTAVPGRSYPGTMCRAVDFGPAGADQAVARPRLATDFTPVTVVRCSVTTERAAGQGEWNVLVEDRASTGIQALVSAMRQPDSTQPAQACLTFLDLDPEVWFLDAAGHAVLPRWPRDSCSHLLTASRKALDGLHWTTGARVRLRQTVPQPAIDAGCEPAWKYLFDLTPGGRAMPKPGTFTDLGHGKDPHLCLYRRAPDDAMRGDFQSGHAVTGSAWSALRAALEATPPAASCREKATLFALLHAGPYIEIELDGCRRILTPDNGLRQATPQLSALLA